MIVSVMFDIPYFWYTNKHIAKSIILMRLVIWYDFVS